MPQQGRRPTAEEVLGLQPRRPTAEEVLGLQPARPSAEQVLGLTPQPPQNESYYQQLKRNVGLGFEQLGQKVSDVAASGAEIVSGIASGNFRPLLEAGELTGRAVGGLLMGGNPSFVGPAQANREAIARVNAEREARRQAEGGVYFRGSQIENAKLEQRAAQDPSLLGRIERGLPQVLPYALAGVASGGSIPAMAATGALMELPSPENIPLSAGLAALPLPSARAVKSALAPAVEKILGRGAAQIVEQEAAQAGQQMALPGMERAVAEAAGQVEKSVARKVVENTAAAYHVPRALMASADASAPLRQSAIFTISNPTMAARATVQMFRAFNSKNFERIASEIAADADARLGQTFGLHLGSQAKTGLSQAEEAFISKFAGKIPVVKQSEQAYTAYLDVMRTQKFSQYKKLIDEAGLSQAQTRDAYKAAAKWINYATGRGSFGETADKALPLLNTFMFAPRYAMSRLNILNPFYYAKNATTEAGRIILRQQAKELFAFTGVVGSTMALAKYGFGADVTLNPNSSDFGKIKLGNYRYDLGAGTIQAVRLVYRIGADLTRMVRGDKPRWGKTAIDVGEDYLRKKLGPVPSWFFDAVKGRTVIGRPYSTGAAIRDRIVPIQWGDWVSAAWEDGIGGVLKTTPGFFGVGVERHDQPGGILERAQPLFSEYARAKRGVPEIRRIKDEPDEQFNARVKVHGEALEHYGMQLVNSDEYKSASVADRDKALDLLPRRISTALLKQGESWQLAPRVIMSDVKESMQLRGR